MKIYFKQKPGKRRGIKSLLKMGFENPYSFKRTFKDPEYTKLEFRSARRSFGDLLLICKTYFPNTTEEKLAKTLLELHKEIGVRASYCTTINKVVFFKDPAKVSFGYGVNGLQKRLKGEGTHSFNEILKLANQK